MKLDVRFSENNLNIPLELSESDQSFNTNMGDVTVVSEHHNGATFYPFVSADGVLYWTNDRDLENPEPVNIRGKDGYTPEKGVDYFTEADKADMVSAVVSALPVYDGSLASTNN